MSQTTKVTSDQLLTYPSENLSDNPDGGGLMVGTPLTGAKNELFPPVSNMDRINGALNIRKIYPAVLRADDEPVYGANFIIAMPPKTPNWSFIAFKAINDAELRKDTAKRIAAFNIKTIPSRMTLMLTQTADSKIFQAYQDVELPLPKVGEVYCLDQNAAGYIKKEQYVRLESIKDEVRTFVDDSNNKFKKRVLTIETREKLQESFVGVSEPTLRKSSPPCIIRETHPADTASYYGIKRLAENALKERRRIKVESLFEKIIPTSNVESRFVTQSVAQSTPALIDASRAGEDGIITLTTTAPFSTGDKLYTGSPIVPNSLRLTAQGSVLTDSNSKLMLSGENIGEVDYMTGEIELTNGAFSGQKIIKFRRAGVKDAVADTAMIPVTVANRRKNYIITVDPPPAKGSFSVSYRAQGSWYTLVDNGAGKLAGESGEYGTGQVDFASSTVTFSFEYLPDADSAILLAWSSSANYHARSEAVVAKQTVNVDVGVDAIAPNTVSVTYDAGAGNVTVNDDGKGNITSAELTGSVSYTDSLIKLTSANLLPSGSSYEIQFEGGNSVSNDITATGPDAAGHYAFDVQQTNVARGTLQLQLGVTINNEHAIVKNKQLAVKEDGNGKLLHDDKIVGSFDNATGLGELHRIDDSVLVATYSVMPDAASS